AGVARRLPSTGFLLLGGISLRRPGGQRRPGGAAPPPAGTLRYRCNRMLQRTQHSKLQSQRQLQRARRKGRRRLAECSAGELRVEAVKVHAIQEIVELRAELEVGGFAGPRNLVVLDHGKIHLRVSRPPECVAAQVALPAQRRRREVGGFEQPSLEI